MGFGFNRQEESRISEKLALYNVRRVLLTAFVSIIALGVFGAVYNITTDSIYLETLNPILGTFFIFSILSMVCASMFISKNQEASRKKLFCRIYWGLFTVLSCLLIYADTVVGGNMVMYYGVLAVLCFVPVLSETEKMYYLVGQFLFIIIMYVKFSASPIDYISLVLINGCFIVGSISNGRNYVRSLVEAERRKDARILDATDELTQLLNVKGFNRRMDVACDYSIRNHERMSIIMFDIDDLQQYNYSYGSRGGQECIAEIAEIIRVGLERDTDIICRVRDGKFVAFISGRDDLYAAKLGDRIRAQVESRRIQHGRHASFPFVTVSVGVSTDIITGTNGFERLMEEAEDALYMARENGKNCTAFDEMLYNMQYSRRAE